MRVLSFDEEWFHLLDHPEPGPGPVENFELVLNGILSVSLSDSFSV